MIHEFEQEQWARQSQHLRPFKVGEEVWVYCGSNKGWALKGWALGSITKDYGSDSREKRGYRQYRVQWDETSNAADHGRINPELYDVHQSAAGGERPAAAESARRRGWRQREDKGGGGRGEG